MYLMIILWILIWGIVLNIAWSARKSLSSYPAPPYPMWWKIWDGISFAFIFLGAMTIAVFVFVNLEPQARFFIDKAPLMLIDINADNFYAGNIIGRTAGEDIPRLQASDAFLDTKRKTQKNIESANLSLEERVVSRLAVSLCTIEVRKEDVVPTGCFKNTDKGFLYVGGSTGSGGPGRRGSQYFEAGGLSRKLC